VSPLVLALDTATEVTAVALGRRDGDAIEVLASCESEAPRAAMSRLLPCIKDLLDSLGVVPTDLAEIVVGRGPGSFTGVRIGVATAKGIAQGLSVPLYGVGTLDAVAWRVAEDAAAQTGRETAASAAARGELRLGVLGDAMRGEVYPARFRLAEGRAERLEPDDVSKPEPVARAWAEAGEHLLLAGNGLRKYREQFESALADSATVAPEGLWSPTGAGLLAAYAAARAGDDAGSGDPGALLPIYTRLSDAEEAEQTKAVGDRGAGEGKAGSGISISAPAAGVRGPDVQAEPSDGAGR
jgi:N6-L-threonylcarbamoyladenine synthase